MNAREAAWGGSVNALRERIVGIERAVPVLGGATRRYVNLDNAASTPVLREVLDTVNRFMEWYASVHRGTGYKSRVSTEAYEDARTIVAGFVGANLREHTVIFGKNTTEAVNKLSYRLPLARHDVVLVSLLDHHSNDLPWRASAEVHHIGATADGALDEDDLDRLLAQHAGRVCLVAVTGGANVTGHMPDVHALAAKAHAAGAQILVDCAQLAPHRAIDMRPLDDPGHLDYVTLSAHKMYAPFGSGALVGRRDTFAAGAPEYRGGGTIDFVGLDEVDWAHGPERDEAGTPNVVGAVALAAAIRELQAVGMRAIAQHEAALTAHALARLACVPGMRIFGDRDPHRAATRLGVIPFQLGALPHGLVAAVLGSEHGIGVRSGCFCAHPYLTHLLGLSPAVQRDLRDAMARNDRRHIPGLVRISFGLYNTIEEIDILVGAIGQIARGEIRGRYVQEHASGAFEEADSSPPPSRFFTPTGQPPVHRDAAAAGPAMAI